MIWFDGSRHLQERKVAFDFSEINVMFVMRLFQWYKSKRATSISSGQSFSVSDRRDLAI